MVRKYEKEKPVIRRRSLKAKQVKKDPTILEVFENKKKGRVLVGYQQFNPKSQGFIFVFDKKYPKTLRRRKIKELIALAGLIQVPIEIRGEK